MVPFLGSFQLLALRILQCWAQSLRTGTGECQVTKSSPHTLDLEPSGARAPAGWALYQLLIRKSLVSIYALQGSVLASKTQIIPGLGCSSTRSW